MPTSTSRPAGHLGAQAGSPNFGFLSAHDPLLARLGALAELHALQDPNSSVIKVRQLAEALEPAQELLTRPRAARGSTSSAGRRRRTAARL